MINIYSYWKLRQSYTQITRFFSHLNLNLNKKQIVKWLFMQMQSWQPRGTELAFTLHSLPTLNNSTVLKFRILFRFSANPTLHLLCKWVGISYFGLWFVSPPTLPFSPQLSTRSFISLSTSDPVFFSPFSPFFSAKVWIFLSMWWWH